MEHNGAAMALDCGASLPTQPCCRVPAIVSYIFNSQLEARGSVGIQASCKILIGLLTWPLSQGSRLSEGGRFVQQVNLAGLLGIELSPENAGGKIGHTKIQG